MSPSSSDGMSSSSQTFSWTVNAISLQNPGDQSNLDGDSVSLQLSASDASNGTLSYSATGLPAGLSINSATGLISGTIASTADASSPYAVTVMATEAIKVPGTDFPPLLAFRDRCHRTVGLSLVGSPQRRAHR